MRLYVLDANMIFAGNFIDVNENFYGALPFNSEIPPPEVQEGQYAKWDGSSWSVLDEYPAYPQNNEPVPASITMRQCRLQLLATGKLALVAPAIAALPSPQREAAEIEWEYGSVVLRSSPLIAQLAPVLGWSTPEEIDEQFRQAARL